MLFVFYGFEPPDCGGSAFPLVELGRSHDSAVNSVEDSFADYIYIYIYIYILLYINCIIKKNITFRLGNYLSM